MPAMRVAAGGSGAARMVGRPQLPCLYVTYHVTYMTCRSLTTRRIDRAERLRQQGITDEQLARIHAPIGLNIGGRTPEEVALSIAAEIIAVRRGAPLPAKPAPQTAAS